MKKLVVNSLLWFVVNQMDKLTTETIVKSIVSFYNEKEVEEAKDCLQIFLHLKEKRPEKVQIRSMLRSPTHTHVVSAIGKNTDPI